MAENITKVKTYDGELHDLEVDLSNYYDKSEADTLLNGKVNNAELDAYYTQAETDSLLNDKADKNTTYTKVQTDSLLADKADKNDVYTDTQVDTLLSAKADVATTYTKAEVYTRSEVDNIVNGKANVGVSYTKTEDDALLSAKADSNDVYTKSEADTLLGAKADSNDVYTKTEADTLLGAKADSNAVYTKTEADTLLGAKANVSDVYTIGQTDNLINGVTSSVANLRTTVANLSNTVSLNYQNTAKLDGVNEFELPQVFNAEVDIHSNNIDVSVTPSVAENGQAYVCFRDENGLALFNIIPTQNTDGSVDLNIIRDGNSNPNGKVLINGVNPTANKNGISQNIGSYSTFNNCFITPTSGYVSASGSTGTVRVYSNDATDTSVGITGFNLNSTNTYQSVYVPAYVKVVTTQSDTTFHGLK